MATFWVSESFWVLPNQYFSIVVWEIDAGFWLMPVYMLIIVIRYKPLCCCELCFVLQENTFINPFVLTNLFSFVNYTIRVVAFNIYNQVPSSIEHLNSVTCATTEGSEYIFVIDVTE